MSCMIPSDYIIALKALDKDLEKHLIKDSHYGFSYYLRGLVCLKLSRSDEAILYFQSAINLMPLLWDAWLELIKLTKNDDEVSSTLINICILLIMLLFE